jgi:Ca2+-binding RTX toxin-like protein
MGQPVKAGGERLANTTTLGSQYEPAVAALAGGGYVVAWIDQSATGGDTDNEAIRAQRFDTFGNKVGPEILVNATTTGRQSQPTIAALADGGFVVGWTDWSALSADNDTAAIRAQRFTSAGVATGAELVVNTTTVLSQTDPDMAALSAGGFVAVWVDSSTTGGDQDSFAIRGQRFAAGGVAAGAEFLVNSTVLRGQSDPAVAGLAGGGFAVVWTDESLTGADANGTAIRLQRYAADGSPSGGEMLVNTITLADQAEADIAALNGGGFVVVWTDYSGEGGDASGTAIHGQRFDAAGAKLGAELLVNATTIGDQTQPTVTALASGGFLVAWKDASLTGGDTSIAGVRARAFDAAGNPDGVEFLVNTTTTQNQEAPALATLPNDTVVAVWADNSLTAPDTSGFSVRSQILGVPATPPANTAAQIFATQGKAAFLAKLANAAYHLEAHEIAAVGWNEGSASADALVTELLEGAGAVLSPLGAGDLPGLAPVTTGDPHYPLKGLSNGIYVNQNAAALLARSGDALFLAFRGTNDIGNGTGNWLAGGGTPDTDHWFDLGPFDEGMEDHYALLADLVAAIPGFVAANGIAKVYVTGHSLGAAMAQAFMDEHPQTIYEAVTFASPGYGFSNPFNDDPRVTNLWLDGDVIELATFVLDNIGDDNTIYHRIDFSALAGDPGFPGADVVLHDVEFYLAYAAFLREQGIDVAELQSLHGIDYETLYANAQVLSWQTRQFAIGTSNDVLISPEDGVIVPGTDDIMLGGAGNDVLGGGGGNDDLRGGTGVDSLYGSTGNDFVYGGDGADVLVLGAGVDTGEGGAGVDYIYAGDGADTLRGDAETDILLGEGDADTLFGGAEQDYLFGGSGIDTLSGGDAVDVMFGDAADDTLLGGAEGDYLYGGAGVDTLNGEAGNDIFIATGEASGDIIFGGVGQDYVYAADGGDSIDKGADVDVILAFGGDDIIDAGSGTDYVWGGAGDDTFRVGNANGILLVHDFIAGGGEDAVNLAGSTLTSYALVQAAMFYSAGLNTTIVTLDADTSVWLIGAAPAQLTSADFLFA